LDDYPSSKWEDDGDGSMKDSSCTLLLKILDSEDGTLLKNSDRLCDFLFFQRSFSSGFFSDVSASKSVDNVGVSSVISVSSSGIASIFASFISNLKLSSSSFFMAVSVVPSAKYTSVSQASWSSSGSCAASCSRTSSSCSPSAGY